MAARLLRIVLLTGALSCAPLQAAPPALDGGHAKARWVSSSYPEDSALRELVGASSHDQGADLRLKFSAGRGAFSLQADYQMQARFGDSLEVSRAFEDVFPVPAAAPDDDRRWWDLSHRISEGDSRVLVHRLDRLHLGYTGSNTVVRFGRQAVSWGNGLIYNPMDFFNPFDPAAVDTEYKLGDDMLYAQYLLESGDDWQFVSVQRRDEDGDVTSEVSSNALKLHHFGLEREYDLLLAEHFDQLLVGAGGVINLGDAVLRGDLVLTDGRQDWVASLVLNWSYSWVWTGLNVSAVAEYFFNGFGLREADYGPQRLAQAEDLIDRISRGELYTLGRHYLAGSLLVEVTPLLNVTPNLFVNLGDGSALLQVVSQWDLAQDWQLLAAVNVPIGPTGTEFGGIEIAVDGMTLGAGPSLLAQIAWYF